MKPRIKPFGIAELLVLKQKLVGYFAGEVAHIENIMPFETRSREHRRLRQTEEIFIVEEELTEESEQDLKSTERFELQQETQKTIKTDTKFEAGAEISGGYGPFIQASAFANYATSTSTEQSEKNAITYAKEITERSLSRIKERVRRERTARTLEEFEEKNLHSFENTSGEPISGIYRWLDKYYRGKVINYGKRLYYEFIAPAPAAFYIFAKTAHLEDNLPEEPEPPRIIVKQKLKPLLPMYITRTNYQLPVKKYGAQDVSPPPPKEIVLSKMVVRELQPEQPFAFVENELEIPKGYVFDSRWWWVSRTATENFRYRTFLSTDGLKEEDEDNNTVHKTGAPIHSVEGILPIGAHGFGLKTFLFVVEITCTLTNAAFQEWQVATFNAIMNAYNKKLLDYEEKMAAAQVQGGVTIGGHNPLINRAIEREELKKACITLWTGTKYEEWASPIQHDEDAGIPANYPEINIDNALEISPEIQFLEQAFDWDNMAYWLYPYYWARKHKWLDNFPLEDNDPLFRDFLRAGAARVMVPVHLAATETVLYYQMTGKLWINGGEIPFFAPPSVGGTLFDPSALDNMDEELALYNSYLAELSGEDAVDDIEKEVEISADDPDTWLIKVPTDLVWLQGDSTLPVFEGLEE